MSFVEIDIFGVYVAPIAPLMVAAYALFFGFRRLAAHFGWFGAVWHPGLFELAVYMIILSALVLLVASLHLYA